MVTVQRMAMINGINVKVIFNSSWVVDFTSYTMEGDSCQCQPIFTKSLLGNKGGISKKTFPAFPLWDEIHDSIQFYNEVFTVGFVKSLYDLSRRNFFSLPLQSCETLEMQYFQTCSYPELSYSEMTHPFHSLLPLSPWFSF